ncbi:hypothetical protein OUZ56_006501 [Daphnia magna]|uniref:Secreted protein n=1 Tax=Daphnia magna TaxID=35525 RepID=A0ABQ9YVU8_9CRUS|nr:hypothetical protein OUZ56_006501 [Daphnia magna]
MWWKYLSGFRAASAFAISPLHVNGKSLERLVELVVLVIGHLFRQQFRFLISKGFLRYCFHCGACVAYARGHSSAFLITKQLQICSTLISIRGKGPAELVLISPVELLILYGLLLRDSTKTRRRLSNH